MTRSTSRGGSEVLFMVLITGVIVLGGTMVVTVATDITSSTSDNIRQPEFEIVDTSPVIIEYTGERPLRDSITDELYFEYDNDTQTDIRYGVYPDRPSVEPGDYVYHSEYSNHTIEYGSRIDVVWQREGGGGSIIQELYTPSFDVTGTSARSDGNVTIVNNSLNLSAGE